MHKAVIVVGLVFGDEGKGRTVDAYTEKYKSDLIVRFNGGAQAGHTVIRTEKRHVFHQFGSGTLLGADTLLSKYHLFNPLALFWESKELEALGISDPLKRIYVENTALITTPYHIIDNKLSEILRGTACHGSCGSGIGATMDDYLNNNFCIKAGGLLDSIYLKKKLFLHWERIKRKYDTLTKNTGVIKEVHLLDKNVEKILEDLYSEEEFKATLYMYNYIIDYISLVGENFLWNRMQNSGCTVFEGAQGVLLDQDYGFNPHTTWSKTTSINALELLTSAGFEGKPEVVGVLRPYSTRHGNGPFPTYSEELTNKIKDSTNIRNKWQGEFRIGHLDLPLLKYTISCNKNTVTSLALSHLDELDNVSKICTRYQYNPSEYITITLDTLPKLYEATKLNPLYSGLEYKGEFTNWISEQLRLPVSLISNGPTESDYQFI